MSKLPKGWKKAARGFGWTRKTPRFTLIVTRLPLLPRYRAEGVPDDGSSGFSFEPIRTRRSAMNLADAAVLLREFEQGR